MYWIKFIRYSNKNLFALEYWPKMPDNKSRGILMLSFYQKFGIGLSLKAQLSCKILIWFIIDHYKYSKIYQKNEIYIKFQASRLNN
jgi:hypothetical protein